MEFEGSWQEMDQFERTRLLIGEAGVNKLQNAHVAVFGIGGVGGYVVESLTRAGVGAMDLIDNDTVSLTNINRQIIANHDTVGQLKTAVMEDRILAINPNAKVRTFNCFYLPEMREVFDFEQYDYVIDAIDTVTAKIDLIMACKEAGTPIISSMGTGNKLNPAMLEVADIYKTSVCPLAKVMRKELKDRGVKHLKVVYSKEMPIKPQADSSESKSTGRPVPGSISFVPPAAGLILASEVVKDLIDF